MASDGIFDGKEPAIRDDPREPGGDRLAEFPCAFCGERQLLIGYADQPEDNYRIDLYCDNPGCDVREMTVMAERADEVLNRADVQALKAVDRGIHAEVDSVGPPSLFERRNRDVEVVIKPKS